MQHRRNHGAGGNKIPGLGDIPWLGRLFGSNKDTVGQSELVLSITPPFVRAACAAPRPFATCSRKPNSA